MTGVERIAAERKRQTEKLGWTTGHDREHDGGELALAATCYAAAAAGCAVFVQEDFAAAVQFRDPWPWEGYDDARPHNGNVLDLDKVTPKLRLRLLEKAGALIAAEIDRLARSTETPAAAGEPKREG